MQQFSKQKQVHADYGTRVMESGDHFKNGASLKSRMSKGNLFISAIAFIFLLLACNSCVSGKKFFANCNAIMQEWVGQTEEHVYMVYGPPSRTQVLQDNGNIVAYDFTGHLLLSDGDLITTCAILFTVRNGTVIQAKYCGQRGALELNIKRP
jgi:hypothetical protein